MFGNRIVMDLRHSLDSMREYLISSYHFVHANAYSFIVCITFLALLNCFEISFNAYHDPEPCSVQLKGLGTDDLITTETFQGVLNSNYQSFGTAIACVVVCVPTLIDTLLDMIPSNIFSFFYNDKRPVLKLRKAEIIRMTHFERIVFIVGIWMIPAAEFQNAFIGNKFNLAWSSRLVVSFNSGSTILMNTSFLLFAYRMSTFFSPISCLIISILLCCSQTVNLAAYRRGWMNHDCPTTDEQRKAILYTKVCGYFLAAFIIICVIKGLYDLFVAHTKQNKLMSSYQSMELQLRNSILLAHLVAASIGIIYHIVAGIPTKSGAPIISDDPQAILKYRIICLIMAVIVFVTEFRCRKNEVTRSLYEAIEVKKKYVQYVNAEIKAPLNVAFLGIRALRDDIQRFPTDRDELHLEIVQEIHHGCLSVSQVINGLLRLEQLELLDHMPSLCETQLLKQTKPLHPFLVHCVASVTTQHAQERNIEMSLNCAPSRLDVDHNIILAHDLDLLLELTGTDVITADLMSLRQAIHNVLTHAVAATPVDGKVIIRAAFLVDLEPEVSDTNNPPLSASVRGSIGGGTMTRYPSAGGGGAGAMSRYPSATSVGSGGGVVSRFPSDAVNDVSSVSPSHAHGLTTYPQKPLPISTDHGCKKGRIISFFRGMSREPSFGATAGAGAIAGAGATAGAIAGAGAAASAGITDGNLGGKGVHDSSTIDVSYTRFMEEQTSSNEPPSIFNFRSVQSTRYPLTGTADDHDHGVAPSHGRDNHSHEVGHSMGHSMGGGNIGDENNIDNAAHGYDDTMSMSGMISGRLVIQVIDGSHACYNAESLFKLFDEERSDDDDDDQENDFDTNRQGLWITKAIVEMHGGKVSAMTSEAGGTVLTIQLPMKRSTNVNNPSIDGVTTTPDNSNNHVNASLLHRLRSKSASVFSSCDNDSVTVTAAERRLHQVLSSSNNIGHGNGPWLRQGQGQGPGQRVNFNFSEGQIQGPGQAQGPDTTSRRSSGINNSGLGSLHGGVSENSLVVVDGKFSRPAETHRWLDMECGHGIEVSVSAPATSRTVAGTRQLTIRRTMEVLQQGGSGQLNTE